MRGWTWKNHIRKDSIVIDRSFTGHRYSNGNTISNNPFLRKYHLINMEQTSSGRSTEKRKTGDNLPNASASSSKFRKVNDNESNRQMLSATTEPLISFADLSAGSEDDEQLDVNEHSLIDDNEKSTLGNDGSASVIAMQYGIIKNIMSFLSMKDIKKMSTVCQLWNAASKAEQRSFSRTHSVKVFGWEPAPNISREQKTWRELQYSNTQFRKTENASSGMNRFAKNSLLDQKINAIQNSPLQKDAQSHIKNIVENMAIEPSLAIIFSVGDVDIGEEYLVASKLVDPKTFHLDLAQVGAILPSKCEVISTCSRGIIIQSSDSKHGTVREIENNGSRIHPAVTGIILPSFENYSASNSDNTMSRKIKVIPFDIPEYSDYVLEKTDILHAINGQKHEGIEMKERETRRQLMKQVFCRNRLKDDDNIKCLIALSNVNENPTLLKLIHAAAVDWTSHHNLKSNANSDSTTNKKWVPTLALGGVVGKLCRYSRGIGPTSLTSMLEEYDHWEQYNQDSDNDADILTGDRSSSYKRSVGLIFAGDGIEAASVILPMSVRNESKVLKELQRLKECKNLGNLDDPNSNSFAFMFACCGRGKYFYKDKTNVESKCFRMLFPHTPLIGIFGEGEFGWNHLPSDKDLLNKEQSEEQIAINSHWFKELREDYICHSYTTVFVLLSINSGNSSEDARAVADIVQFASSSQASM